MKTLRIVRGNDVKFSFLEQSIKIDSKGRIWCQKTPILGITDPEEKKAARKSVKAQEWDKLTDTAYTRLGDNPNGLWAGWDTEWKKHPLKKKLEEKARLEAIEKKKLRRVYLSSCGWGDYSSIEWVGDITRPENEILAECRKLLETSHDVDQPNQTDDVIMRKVREEKAKYQEDLDTEQAEKDQVKKEDAEIEALDVTVKVIKSGKIESGDGEGCYNYYTHMTVTDNKTGDSLDFNCRNIFDFGYVVNPDYSIADGFKKGGLAHKDEETGAYCWQNFDKEKGWINVREMTDFERRACAYLSKKPPIYSGINM